MKPNQKAFDELCYYTLSHKPIEFIHQYAVDAYTAQTANESTKPIALYFALIGLYLHVEKGYTGKEVQLMHMKLAKKKNYLNFKHVELPKERGDITVVDVMKTTPGNNRDQIIDIWCKSVWESYHDIHHLIVQILNESE